MDTEKWPGAGPFVPRSPNLDGLRASVQGCRGCSLYENATQAVFGDGAARARIMIVGEVPGDVEDKVGETFVGPAGRVLMDLFAELGVSRREFYLTNAVKHFKFEPRGKRRIHSRPLRSEIVACRPWLEAEIRCVRPAVILCLGAVAAQSLLGPSFSVLRDRGKVFATEWADALIATYHPSTILRAPDATARAKLRREIKHDIEKALAESERTSPQQPKGGLMARKYGKKAGSKVKRAMDEMKHGALRSGRSGKKVTSRKQAIAIGLSEARKAGAKVPKKGAGKKAAAKKASKKRAPRKAAKRAPRKAARNR